MPRKTVKKHKPTLQYEYPFDKNKGAKEKIKIFFKLRTSTGELKTSYEEQYLRSESLEELLHTVDIFLKLQDKMEGFDNDMLITEFKKLLSHQATKNVNELICTQNYLDDWDGFDQLVLDLSVDYYNQDKKTKRINASVDMGWNIHENKRSVDNHTSFTIHSVDEHGPITKS